MASASSVWVRARRHLSKKSTQYRGSKSARLPPVHRISILLLLGFTAGLAVGCREKAEVADSSEPAKNDPMVVQLAPKALEAAGLSTGKPKVSPRRTVVVATGTLDFVPSHVARIGSQLPGRVSSVLVAPGQQVTRGATVAVVDSADVGRARADVLASRVRLKRWDEEVSREERLFAGRASSERELFTARAERSVAQVEVKAAEDRLHIFGARTSSGASSLPLVAPLSGKVLDVQVRIGQTITASDTVVVIGETDQLWLAIDIYERDIAKVRIGDDVRVLPIAFPDRVFEGKVDHLGAVVDAERKVIEGRVVLNNPDGILKPGMTVTARVLGGAMDNGKTVLTVPRGAMQAIDGLPYVFVELEKGKYELRPVERGADLDDGVEIVRGLNGQETVVVEGTFLLKSEVLREQMGAND